MKNPARWLLVGALCGPLAAAAETVYVTDQVTIGLRTAVAPDAAVVKSVSTGAALEVLERRGSLAKVRDHDGAEGWIETAVLLPQPPAALQLKALQAELGRARARLVRVQAELDQGRAASPPAAELEQLRNELAAARRRVAQTEGELQRKEQELGDAAGPLAEAAPPSSADPSPDPGFRFLWLGIAFAMLVLGFVGGIVWVKESIRRRMGGMYLRI